MDTNIRLEKIYKDGTLEFIEIGNSGEVVRTIKKHIDVFNGQLYMCSNFWIAKNGTCNYDGINCNSPNELIKTMTKEEYTDGDLDALIGHLELLAQVDNSNIRKINTYCGNSIYKTVDTAKNECTIIVPKNVVALSPKISGFEDSMWNRSEKYKTVKVVGGGEELIRIDSIFKGLIADYIDMSELDISEVLISEAVYDNAVIKNLDLSWINRCNLTSMRNMFRHFSGGIIDLRHIDTSHVKSMSGLFSFVSNVKVFGLEQLNTCNVKNMSNMFAYFNSDNALVIDGWNVREVEDMSEMFKSCCVPTIDIHRWKTEKLRDCSRMFDACESKLVGLSNLHMDNVECTASMFAEAKLRDTDIVINSRLDKCKNTTTMFRDTEATSVDISALRCTVGVLDKHSDMFDGMKADIKIKAWDMLNEMSNRKGNRAYIDFTNEIAKHIGKGSISFK